ncbi:MAG: hypothetical protein KC776_33520 [Myxococcales bacterium]|nr:hypothetical protein [Myxococcales bacterium]
MSKVLLSTLLLLTSACGGSTLEPVQDGTGGTTTGGTGGTGGNNTTGGTGGNSTGGSSGAAGSGGQSACTTPNPAGCKQTGCDAGFVCNTDATVCKPSSCTCGASSNTWGCTLDCGGGVCTPSPTGKDHFVRIGFTGGQVNLSDFCVAYSKNGNDFVFESQGLLAANGEAPETLNGFQRFTKYLPLDKAPLAFALATGGSCSNVFYVAETPTPTPNYMTLLSAPYSGEAPEVWVLPDSGPQSGSVSSRYRVINATSWADSLKVDLDGADASTALFGAQGDYSYATASESHLWKLNIDDGQDKYVGDFVNIDLLALSYTTIFVVGAYRVIGCLDGKGQDATCFEATTTKLQ